MADHLYQKGDRVRCISSHGYSSSPAVGEVYIVRVGGSQVIALEGIESWQYTRRFEPVDPNYCEKCSHPHGYHDAVRGCTMPLDRHGWPIVRTADEVQRCGCGRPEPVVDHDAPDHDRAYCMTCDNRSRPTTESEVFDEAVVRRAVRTLLPGLRHANYVERWSPQSPAVRALSILCEFVGDEPMEAGDLIHPDVPTAHACRPEGRVSPPERTSDG